MTAKILILYQFELHFDLLSNLMEYLRRNHINADLFNVTTWQLSSTQHADHVRYSYLTSFLLGIPKLRGIVLRLFRNRKILSVVRNYDIIDIHYFSEVYYNILPQIKQIDKTIKVTFWGSDLYLADRKTITIHATLLNYVDCIQVATEKMQIDLVKMYPDLADKIRIGHFGIKKFQIIDNLQSSCDSVNLRHQFKISGDLILITCGYNGSKRQQHFAIIESIKSLPKKTKDRCFFLFPMTYGGSKRYMKSVDAALRDEEISYSLITKSMTENEISNIRIVTDIFINIQESDAFSASLQEHVYAGNVTVVGDWLPYDIFFKNDIYLIKTSINSLRNVIEEVISNFSIFKAKCANNKIKLAEISSWEKSIQEWVAIFREMDSNKSVGMQE